MHSVLKFFLCLSLLFGTTNPQSNGWRGIVPLQSTRAEVELILGQPTKGAEHYAFHKFENETVTIWYAIAGCGEEKSSGWNVPLGTVLAVTMRPTKVTKLVELQLDLSKFKREVNDHFPDESFYRDNKEGFEVVTIRENVSAVRYYPSENQNHLRCVGDNKQKRRRESATTKLTAEEKAMIDRFITCLKQEPDSTGWIRVDIEGHYASDPDLTELVFRYLNEKYPSEIKRISVMGGTFGQDHEIEFFVIPPDGKPIPFRP